MELYHDEYSTYYNYDSNEPDDSYYEDNATSTSNINGSSDDVIELSDSDDESGKKPKRTELNEKSKKVQNSSANSDKVDYIVVQPDNEVYDSTNDYDEDDFDETVEHTKQSRALRNVGISFMEDDEETNIQMYNRNGSVNLENYDGTYRCPLCPKEVVSKYNLKRHMMIHTG